MMSLDQNPRAVAIATRLLAACLLSLIADSHSIADEFHADWRQQHDRIWVGAEFWSNPMEDWVLRGGRLECTSTGPGRSVHVLTRELSDRPQGFETRVSAGRLTGQAGAVGFELGVHDDINDYRGNCIWGTGISAVLQTSETGDSTLRLGSKSQPVAGLDVSEFMLVLTGTPAGEAVQLKLAVHNRAGEQVASVNETVLSSSLIGNLALSHNSTSVFPAGRRQQPAAGPRPTARFWFQDWKLTGDRLDVDASRRFGPILWSMYTLSDSRSDEGYVVKMSALLPPLGAQDNRTVRLQLFNAADEEWLDVGRQEIDSDAYTATFRIPNWDANSARRYRLVYQMTDRQGRTENHYWGGTIRQQPLDRPLVMGGLTCQEHRGFPYAPVAQHLAQVDPDLLFFSGDQLYESSGGFGIIRRPADRAIINFLRKFYMFGWAFGPVMADRPTVCIPDDHDVFQGNIWGEGGAAMPEGGNTSTDGGYIEPVRMVQVVHRVNTAHHPKLFDPTPVKQGMSVYYGDMVYGRVSFAIIGDRQFKSAPGRVNTGEGRADHVTSPEIDVEALDKPGLELLGERQEKFLEHWVGDWRGADMKVLLSETVFANAATHHGREDGYLFADLDSGGWPQTARDNALRITRKGFALHVNGDQHLTSMLQYGIDGQRDGGWSFCTPAISVGYQRWWRPDEIQRPHANRPDHGLPHTGEYVDGFGNPVYMYAVGNPEGSRDPNRYTQAHIKASGFGIIRIDPKERIYRCEAYRFLKTNPDQDLPEQFPGWPVEIHQLENDGRQPTAWLPPLNIHDEPNAIVRVYTEPDGELLYAIRILGDRYQPPVFAEGRYRVEILNDDGLIMTLKGFHAQRNRKQAAVEVRHRKRSRPE